MFDVMEADERETELEAGDVEVGAKLLGKNELPVHVAKQAVFGVPEGQ